MATAPFRIYIVTDSANESRLVKAQNPHLTLCANNLGHRFHDEACGNLLQILWRELVVLVEVDGDLAQECLDDLFFG